MLTWLADNVAWLCVCWLLSGALVLLAFARRPNPTVLPGPKPCARVREEHYTPASLPTSSADLRIAESERQRKALVRAISRGISLEMKIDRLERELDRERMLRLASRSHDEASIALGAREGMGV